jgi:peptide-methionine (S)-S-oxide reductase
MRRILLPALLLIAASACHRTEATPMTITGSASATAASSHRAVGVDPGGVGAGTPLAAKPGDELAAFAGGCFWGVEDKFRQVNGVVATAVGYTGGHTTSPTYEDVCTHTTGHAEAVLVEYDPKQVSYQALLDIFFANHDPTTMNRQGPDVGDNYRSAIFTFSPEQEQAVRATAAREEKKLGKKVTTKVAPIGQFWKAEEYHQQYDEKSGTHSCPLVLPKSI